MGKFQDVPLFGFVIKPSDLTVPGCHVESISQCDHTNVKEGTISKHANGAKNWREIDEG